MNGVSDGTSISIYNINGVQLGTTICRNGCVSINTGLPNGSVVIVKIGKESVKIIMK